MEKDSLLTKINHLEVRVQHLLMIHQELKEELSKTKAENTTLKHLVEEQKEELKNFQNQLKISRIVSSMAESTRNSTELKLKINEYIREIDKCIAHLSD